MAFRHGATGAVVVALALAGVGIAASSGARHHDTYASPMMGAYSAAPATSSTQWHRFRGTVTSANRAHHSFWMRTITRRSVQIYVNGSTSWGNCGWGYMHHGYRVDVHAYRSHGHWMASRMQSWHHGWMP